MLSTGRVEQIHAELVKPASTAQHYKQQTSSFNQQTAAIRRLITTVTTVHIR